MSTWRALPGMLLGQMIEVLEDRTPGWCDPRVERVLGRRVLEHDWAWKTDIVACKRCPATDSVRTEAFLGEMFSPEGLSFVAWELENRKRAA